MEFEPEELLQLIRWHDAAASGSETDSGTDGPLREKIVSAYLRLNVFVRNKPVDTSISIGDYVFASRWGDCSPGDPWAVGGVTEVGDGYVVVGDASGRRFPKAMKITHEQGARICASFPELEGEPFDGAKIAEIFGEKASVVY